MAVSKDEILDAISKMTLLEVTELISDMEKKFGVTAAAPVAVAAAPGAAAAAAELPTADFGRHEHSCPAWQCRCRIQQPAHGASSSRRCLGTVASL